ncbi:MAG: glycosyltransferase family 4 protein [Anaerolineae bacterium]|nr:glycosyltransferase family 4 protein [Anaerolineae bacterium]
MAHYVLDARTATPHFPGIGRYVSNLARAAAPHLATNERLTVLYDPAYPLSLPKHSAIASLPVVISPFSVLQQWQIPRLLRRLGADVYHSAYFLMPYFANVPTILTLYDVIPLLFPEHSTWRARWFFRVLMSLALRRVQQTLPISEATQRDFTTYFALSAECATTIPLAADPIFGLQPADAVTTFRVQHALPERFVLYLGSNKPHKNLLRLLDAWAHVVHEFPDYHLVIAGAWVPQHPEPRQRAVALGISESVHWHGPVSNAELPLMYAAADVFVFPTLYEGFGLPVVEAMACGTPVTCSQTSSLPEIAGDAAVLFPPTDSIAIASSIMALLKDAGLRLEMRERGLQQVRKFSWEYTAAQTLAVYRRIADRKL